MSLELKIFIIYLAIINTISFIVMGIDKRRAIKHKWRIPEKTLFLLAVLLGSIGTNLGMKIFRHKTKHIVFVIGMPAILTVQICLCVLLLFIK